MQGSNSGSAICKPCDPGQDTLSLGLLICKMEIVLLAGAVTETPWDNGSKVFFAR